MSIANKQLEQIHQEIQEQLSGLSSIIVKPTQGTPPEKYEITYNIMGMHKDENGSLTESTAHVVNINIPFGYPHFPPSCTPVSPIFHPDFDPAAICIGDFWNQGKTLPDLIIFIGQLISGERFSEDNAFNETAAEWYKDNSSELPFSELDLTKQSQNIDGKIEELQANDDDLDLDVIEDHDLSSDFSYLSIDDPTEESSESPQIEQDAFDDFEPEETSGVDLDLILLMRRKKRFTALQSHLNNLPDEVDFDQKTQITQLTQEELATAAALYSQAEELEHLGESKKAYDKYKEISLRVSDYPSIEEDLERAKQSIELFGGISDSPKPAKSNQAPSVVKKDVPKKKDTKKKKRGLTFFEDEQKKKTNFIPLVASIAVLTFLGGAVIFYFSASNQFSKASEAFKNCQSAIKQNKFTTAEKSCTEAITEADKVQFIKQSACKQLTKDANKILKSEKLKHGLAGKVLYDGEYLFHEKVSELKKVKKLIKDGDDAYGQEHWTKAVALLKQALIVAHKSGKVDQKIIIELQDKLNTAVFHSSYSVGKKHIELKQWDKAIEQLLQTQKALPQLETELRISFDREVGELVEVATFYSLLDIADIHFEKGDWNKAIDSYKRAINTSPNILSEKPALKHDIDENMVRSDLYLTIESGKKAFSSSNWDEAILRYDNAIKALNENKELLKQESSNSNKKKLSRIKLQASIIRDKQAAARNLKSQDYDKAIQRLNAIITSIERSDFSTEDEFVSLHSEVKISIEEASHTLFLQEKVLYLTEVYKELFITNYPAATAESLSEPEITFVKQIDEGYLYKLQCTEKGRGRPLRLVINYLYNPITDKWSFYTGR